MPSNLENLDLDGIVVPDVVRELAAGRTIEAVWRNQIGGITFSIGAGAEYVKYGPPHAEFEPGPEFARLRWLGDFVAAPRPIDHGADAEGNLWLRTEGLPGTSAVMDGWRERPDVVVPELGRALRRFHDRVPVERCPWDWSVATRSGYAALPAGGLGPSPVLDPVVCHGDACNPNFVLDASGTCVGYVDLGRLGVADRWADLSPALCSLVWNFGEGWEPALLEGYGIEPDAEKQDFYTRLWNLT